jgi:multidrug efflux pump subunit AcrA (membrane-fusion protein)
VGQTMLKRRRNTLLGVILVCSAVTFIFSGCGLLPKEDDTLAPPLIEPKKQEYELYEVKRGDIVSSLKGNGYFVASDEKSVFTKENGRRIESIKVKYGDHVEKGQVLVELDSGDLNNSIKIQQQVFRKAKVNLERSKKDGDSYNIELADADYIIEKTRLESLQNELSKLKLVLPVK